MTPTSSMTNPRSLDHTAVHSRLTVGARTRFEGLWQELQRQRTVDLGEIGLDELQLPASELRPDLIDRAAADRERELCVQTKTRAYDRLHQIDLALLRMEQGTYGICIRCEQEIPPARLEVQPTASTCIACQERVEQGIRNNRPVARLSGKESRARR